ncbi:hypothetical protein E2C01_063144 [Portunus trituberculatus]|uniref:Uncharacterized protein n=1 Tax=Portunus trituberculatus TaxID=210409 RepID=A0A5B7HFK7_PORTR|nr:hypothetical protein [Portunus trituberculatus]
MVMLQGVMELTLFRGDSKSRAGGPPSASPQPHTHCVPDALTTPSDDQPTHGSRHKCPPTRPLINNKLHIKLG